MIILEKQKCSTLLVNSSEDYKNTIYKDDLNGIIHNKIITNLVWSPRGDFYVAPRKQLNTFTLRDYAFPLDVGDRERSMIL